jgi:drug/metabolite transporter (DMT)-like permease
MEMTVRDKRPFWRSRWWMPLFSLALGGMMFAAYAIGGDAGEGLYAFGVMAAVAALFFFGGRSETLRGLGGPGRDERWAAIDLKASAIDLKASAFAGLLLITVVIGAFMFEIANGDDGSPYGQLGAIAGVAYIAAVAFLRRRS